MNPIERTNQPERSKREDALKRKEMGSKDKRTKEEYNPYVITSNSIPMPFSFKRDAVL